MLPSGGQPPRPEGLREVVFDERTLSSDPAGRPPHAPGSGRLIPVSGRAPGAALHGSGGGRGFGGQILRPAPLDGRFGGCRSHHELSRPDFEGHPLLHPEPGGIQCLEVSRRSQPCRRGLGGGGGPECQPCGHRLQGVQRPSDRLHGPSLPRLVRHSLVCALHSFGEPASVFLITQHFRDQGHGGAGHGSRLSYNSRQYRPRDGPLRGGDRCRADLCGLRLGLLGRPLRRSRRRYVVGGGRPAFRLFRPPGLAGDHCRLGS